MKRWLRISYRTLMSSTDECGIFPIVARVGIYGVLLYGILFIQAVNFDASELVTIVTFASIMAFTEMLLKKSHAGKILLWHLSCLIILIGFLTLLLNQAANVREAWYRTNVLDHRVNDLIQTAPSAIIVSNGLGNIKYINRKAENIIGWTQEELKNKPLSLLMRSEKYPIHKVAFDATVARLKEGTAEWIKLDKDDFYILAKNNKLIKIDISIVGVRFSPDGDMKNYPPGEDIEFYAILETE